MSLIKLGSFLTEEQISENKYKYNKPIIKLATISCLIFALSSCIVMGFAVIYMKINTPQPIVSEEQYLKAQKQSLRINKDLALIKSIRKDFNVCKVVSLIGAAANTSDVNLTHISLNSNQFIMKGFAKDLDVANKFNDSLFFDDRYSKNLSNIQGTSSSKDIEFTTTVICPITEKKEIVK